MTAEQLQKYTNLAEAATPGPWWVNRYATDMSCTEHEVGIRTDDMILASLGIDDVAMPDASFIAAARDAVPALVAEVRRLQAELAAVPVGAIRHMRDFTVNCAVAGSIEWQSSFVVTEWLIDNVEGAA